MSDSYVIIIPSRLASTRLPRKALADICGKSLIQRVYEVANKTRAKNVYIATDDNEIFDHVKNFSENVIMTSKDHISGTDRIHEAANELNLNPDQTIINLQGDEPFVPLNLVNCLAESFNSSNADIGTVITKFLDDEDISNPNSVKVSISNTNKALYFSRSVIPDNFTNNFQNYFRHIGIYAYKKSTLDTIVILPPSNLELLEQLEQLRFLENSFTIQTPNYSGNIPARIDTQADFNNAINQINDPLAHRSKNEEGKITFFSGCLPHYTDTHMSDEERITIAMDLSLIPEDNFIKIKVS